MTTASPRPAETRLQLLHDVQGQSPWLDDLRRSYLVEGDLRRWVAEGIRGVTSNPAIFQRAIAGSTDYDTQFAALAGEGRPLREAYWAMVVDDITNALNVLRPVFLDSDGSDGFVSVELAPDVAHDTDASVAEARSLHDRLDAPNLFVKIPATSERTCPHSRAWSPSSSAASMPRSTGGSPGSARRRPSICRDRRGSRRRGSPTNCSSSASPGPRWDALVARGARVQRPLWASTSTKNPADPDTRYIDELIGPDTVTTIPTATVASFQDHGTLSRTMDRDLDAAHDVLDRLGRVGVDLSEVSTTLETEGITSFSTSFNALMGVPEAKAETLVRQPR